VFSQTSPASLVGVVTASWKIPVNATIDSYMVTVSGTSTFKTPLDAQHFTVNAATMSVATIAIFKPIYQRTESMRFSFQPTYPDASLPSTGVGLLTLATPSGYLLYSRTPAINDSVPMVFDTTLGLWVGSYTARSTDAGGLWSLVVKASDSPSPANTGTATRAINIQNNPPASFPLYYFGIIAALIAGLPIAVFLVFKRHRVT